MNDDFVAGYRDAIRDAAAVAGNRERELRTIRHPSEREAGMADEAANIEREILRLLKSDDRALIRELAEALLEAEAVFMIVQPRSNMREYLAALGSVRAALAKVEETLL